MTLSREDANSKLVDVVTVADVYAEKMLTTVWCRLGCKNLVIKYNFCSDFGQDFKVEVQARI